MISISSKIVVSVFLAVALAFALQLSPGEPEWSHDPPPFRNSDDLVRFVGGDGFTKLTGRLSHPITTAATATNTTDDVDGYQRSPPVIVLAHGLGLSHDCGLNIYVQAFTAAGWATFTFDYATFGASDGYPRHQVHPWMHIADTRAAVRFIHGRGQDLGVDANKIALWGTSLGGGHVLLAAASTEGDGDTPTADPSIRAVVAQVPHLASGAESAIGTIMQSPGTGIFGLAQALLVLSRSAVEGLLRGRTWYIPLVGKPGSAGMMQNPGDYEGYLSLTPKEGGEFGWRNAATAVSLLRVSLYRPLNTLLDTIRSPPSLLVAAENDTLCPSTHVQRASEILPNAELLALPDVGHFDVYSGDVLKEILAATIAFFQKHLADD